jgi:hypothetical protein
VAIEGFISHERFASLGRRWPTHALHREIHAGLGAALEPDTVPLDGDVFNSIIAPSDGLSRRGWPDIPSAQAGIEDAPGRHGLVQIIRNYSIFALTAAPQYFPPP